MAQLTPPDSIPITPQATILLVDDDPSILEGVADLLSLYGYRVVTATDGYTGLEAMSHTLPDLVISDITMPNMDGYAFFEAVRSNGAWTTIPFIFLTARGQQNDIRRGHSLGADAYLVKPFEPEDLLIAVQGRLSRVRDIQLAAQSETERMKQQLITTFSHELRTPLTYIYGYINLLLDQLETLDPETLREMLVGVFQGAERLVHLVEDLMLLVRIDSGVVEMEVALRQSTERIAVIVDEVLHAYHAAAEARQVQINVSVSEEVGEYCASTYLQDVLSRLVDNAVKFCRQGEGRVVIEGARNDGHLVIAVHDNGIGIAPAHQGLIFERFQQLDRDVLEQQGIGLGLTLARALVQLQGGEIAVESAPGRGSVFTVILPLEGYNAPNREEDCGRAPA